MWWAHKCPVRKSWVIHVCLCMCAHICIKCAMKAINTYIRYMCDEGDTHTYVWIGDHYWSSYWFSNKQHYLSLSLSLPLSLSLSLSMCDMTYSYVWTVEMPAFMPDRHVIGAQADDWPKKKFGGKCAHDRCRWFHLLETSNWTWARQDHNQKIEK